MPAYALQAHLEYIEKGHPNHGNTGATAFTHARPYVFKRTGKPPAPQMRQSPIAIPKSLGNVRSHRRPRIAPCKPRLRLLERHTLGEIFRSPHSRSVHANARSIRPMPPCLCQDVPLRMKPRAEILQDAIPASHGNESPRVRRNLPLRQGKKPRARSRCSLRAMATTMG